MLVTSCTRALLTIWPELLTLPSPALSDVTVEDVAVGKPDAACYRLGRERIRCGEGARVLVFEDAPAGVRAGKGAGSVVFGCGEYGWCGCIEGADWVVEDLGGVRVGEKEEDDWGVWIEKIWVGKE